MYSSIERKYYASARRTPVLSGRCGPGSFPCTDSLTKGRYIEKFKIILIAELKGYTIPIIAKNEN
jgi:hypothetical protein